MSGSSLSPIIVKYEKLLNEDPRSQSFAPLAEAYRQVGLLDKAFDILKKGLRYNPEYLHGYLTLALCYVDKKEYGLAYSTLKPLIAHNRDNLKLQRVFADCARKTNNLEEALDSYKYLLFLNPKDRDIANQVSLLEEDLHEEAVYAKEKRPSFNVDDLSANPEDDKEIDNWVEYDLVIPPKKKEDDEVSQWSIGKSDDTSSNSKLNFEIKDLQEGIHEVETDLSFDEDNRYAILESKENETEEKILDLEDKSLVEVGQEMAPVITHTLVDIYIKQGHYRKAREIIEQIIEIDPKSKVAVEKLEKINGIINAQGQTKEEVESEGRENLMAAFDKSVESPIIDNKDTDSSISYDSNGLIDKINLVLNDYLQEIQNKSL